jgi:hypothetical protein
MISNKKEIYAAYLIKQIEFEIGKGKFPKELWKECFPKFG